MSKFGLIWDSGTLQFRNEAMHLITNTNLASNARLLDCPKIWCSSVPHLWETGSFVAPKFCVKNICWISQLKRGAAPKVYQRLSPTQCLKPWLMYFTCPSPNSYRVR